MPVMLYHGETGMAQILLEQENIATVQKKTGGISVAEEVSMKTFNTGGN